MKKHVRTLEDMKARFMFEKLTNFMASDRKDPPKKKIQGMFRRDSYDWIVFKFFLEKGEWKFQFIEHVQHEGECLKHLKKKVFLG